jgi:hypothetical protein
MEANGWFGRLLAMCDAGNPSPLHAKALFICGHITYYYDPAAGQRFGEESLRMARSLEYKQGIVNALWLIGWAYTSKLDESADPLFAESIKLAREIDYAWGAMHAYAWCGVYKICIGNYEAAKPLCQAARTSYLRSPTRWVKGAAASEDNNHRKNFQILLKSFCNARDNYSMEVRSDPFESAKSHFFDTSSWGAFCDVTLTLKQARQPDSGGWVKIDDYRCRQAFRHFMNLLNRAVYGAAFRRYGKSLRVLPVLEKGEVGARALRSWDRGTSGR